jgi:hypothetical protein
MPFVSEKDNKGFDRVYGTPVTPYEDPLNPTFGEVVSSGFGSVVDEDLTISRFLNQQFRNERLKRTEDLIRQGAINRERYQDQSGLFDFNRLHRDLRGTDYDGLIDADYQVREKRNEMLKKRREGRDAILAEGSGLAQFIGMGGAYMFAEPVSLLTLPIGTVTAAHKGLTVTATALNTAKNTAALNAASELAIQPFVYAHKEDIESPYSYLDSIAAVTFAATGGAALGGVAGGIAGYFRSVKDRASLAKLGVERNAKGEININTLPLDKGKESKELALRIMEAEEQSPTGRISDKEAMEVIQDYYNPIADLPDNLQKAMLWAQEQGESFTTSGLQKHLRIGYNPTRQVIDDLKGMGLLAEDDAANVFVTKAGRAAEPDMAARALDDVADYVDDANSKKPKSPARLIDDQNSEVIQYKKSYEIARDDAKTALVAERDKLEKSAKWKNIIGGKKGFGGLNKKAWAAEGIDPATWKGTTKKVKSKKDPSKLVDRAVPPSDFPPGFWRAGDEGLTPDGLMEMLRDRQDLGFVYERFDDVTGVGANEAMQLVESIVENPNRYVDDIVQNQIDDIDMRIDELDRLSDDELKAFFSKNSEEVMREDIELIKEYEEGRRSAMEPAIKSEDFLPPEYSGSPAATLSARERELLENAGYADDLDEAMAQYQALAEDKRIYTVDGEEVDFDQIIKGLDEQLEESSALRRCVYGE